MIETSQNVKNKDGRFCTSVECVVKAHRLEQIMNVPEDENCVYHSFMLGLKEIGKGDKFKQVTDLRYEL